MEDKKIEFLPLNFEDELEEEMYLESKSYFLDTFEKLERNLVNIDKAIDENDKILNGFLLLQNSNELGAEQLESVNSIVENLKSSKEELEKTKQRMKTQYETINVIIEDCFTEKVENGKALVKENGKIFSRYFSLYLDVTRG